MRLFTALDLSGDVVGRIEKALRRLEPVADIRWSHPANLHVTTKFIGEWPEGRLPELKQALGGIPARDAIEVNVRKMGYFPNPRSPKVFWCGIEARGLAELAADTDAATALLGIPKETRPFSPHLTLARIKDRFDPAKLDEAVRQLPSLD